MSNTRKIITDRICSNLAVEYALSALEMKGGTEIDTAVVKIESSEAGEDRTRVIIDGVIDFGGSDHAFTVEVDFRLTTLWQTDPEDGE